MSVKQEESHSIGLWSAIFPVLVLVGMLMLSVIWFGDDASQGANQIALLIAAGLAAWIGMRHGQQWVDIEQGIINGIANAMIAVLILFVVGALIGSWMLSGTVQSLIYYGLWLISAEWFYAAACFISAVAALSIGSSWTVAGTLGIAFMGMAAAMQLNPALTAGAVISGAYFGDKLSPLSDTANLAAAVTQTPLFEHIRQSLWTSIPAFVIALSIYLMLGGQSEFDALQSMQATRAGLREHYHLGLHLLLPVLVVGVLAWRRVPALITLVAGAASASLLAVIFQQEGLARFVGRDGLDAIQTSILAVWIVLYDGYTASTGNDGLDALLTRGGMISMLITIWLIICAMTFGAVMEQTGLLQRIMHALLRSVETSVGLVVTTVFTAIGSNFVTADQYISIVLPGRMFRLEYAEKGLDSSNLSRALGDSAIVTSPLIPWNSCGAYMAVTLGVSTWAYAPYAFFNLLGPVMCIAFVATHFRVVPLLITEKNDA